MKQFVLFILVFITYSLNATVIYVATDGDNGTGDGSIGSPYLTIAEALTHVSPGDTIYVRGGVYTPGGVEGTTSEINGTADNLIYILNYPGEIPIIDGKSFYLWYSDYYFIRGLTVRNVPQPDAETRPPGFYFYNSENITIKNCVAHDIGARGFQFYNCDKISVKNCDAYNIIDSLSSSPGNAGDGFIFLSAAEDTTAVITFENCRAWQVSDDGWDIHHKGLATWDNCWAFLCGAYGGADLFPDGNGIKMNLSVTQERKMVSRIVRNCIIVYNRNAGITTNDNNEFPLPMQIYNNTSMYNGLYGSDGYGFRIYNSSGTDTQEQQRMYKNNIAYANTTSNFGDEANALTTNEYNSWNTPPGKTPTDDSFLSVADSSTLINALMGPRTGSRDGDWNLPDIGDYYKLNPNAPSANNLIDQGTDVGLDYEGDAPDLGAFEYTPAASTPSDSKRLKIGGKAIKFNGKYIIIE